jgi:hypothetical protein
VAALASERWRKGVLEAGRANGFVAAQTALETADAAATGSIAKGESEDKEDGEEDGTGLEEEATAPPLPLLPLQPMAAVMEAAAMASACAASSFSSMGLAMLRRSLSHEDWSVAFDKDRNRTPPSTPSDVSSVCTIKSS